MITIPSRTFKNFTTLEKINGSWDKVTAFLCIQDISSISAYRLEGHRHDSLMEQFKIESVSLVTLSSGKDFIVVGSPESLVYDSIK